jgi:hypothetical protein
MSAIELTFAWRRDDNGFYDRIRQWNADEFQNVGAVSRGNGRIYLSIRDDSFAAAIVTLEDAPLPAEEDLDRITLVRSLAQSS